MKFELNIKPSELEKNIRFPFNVDGIFISNPTPYTLYVARGTLNYPNDLTHDYTVLGGQSVLIPATYTDFAFRFLT